VSAAEDKSILGGAGVAGVAGGAGVEEDVLAFFRNGLKAVSSSSSSSSTNIISVCWVIAGK
jgi:hypothetical protein